MEFAKLFIKGTLFNVFLNKDFINKDTGEVKEGKTILQFMSNKNGKMIFVDVSAPKDAFQKYLTKKNQVVEVPVKLSVFNNKIFFNLDEEVKNG